MGSGRQNFWVLLGRLSGKTSLGKHYSSGGRTLGFEETRTEQAANRIGWRCMVVATVDPRARCDQ